MFFHSNVVEDEQHWNDFNLENIWKKDFLDCMNFQFILIIQEFWLFFHWEFTT